MSTFQEIQPENITDNAIKLIGKDWMLITAGTMSQFNMMTASWGGIGNLWRGPVAFAFVRPQRYTFPLMEANAHFTLSFYDVGVWRDMLNFCGTNSGRDVDKVASTGLTPVEGETGAVYFAEARLVLECRKVYAQDLKGENFIDPEFDSRFYAAKDYHKLYVGEIVRCLVR